MDAMKAGTARPEAATALTVATALTGVAGASTFRSAVEAYAGAAAGCQTRVIAGGKVSRASACVRSVKDVSACETASSHTGIQLDSIPFRQNGTVRAFVEPGTIFKYIEPTAHESPELPGQVPTGRGTMICTAGPRAIPPGDR
jgi:hypothetical protein